MKLWALAGPTLTFDRSGIEPGTTGLVTIPCPSFLVAHDRGLVLFDTGPDPRAAVDAEAEYGSALVEGLGLRFAPEQSIDRQLAVIGAQPADIDLIVLSHLHFDHCGAVYLFENARIIVGSRGIQEGLNPGPSHGFGYRQLDIERIPRSRLIEVTGDYDLYDDGGLVLLPTPGHTSADLSLQVVLESGTVVLAGDAAHSQAQLEGLFTLPSDTRPSSTVQSLTRLQKLRDEERARIWVSHDPDDWARYAYDQEAV